jgi:hypothetical protein
MSGDATAVIRNTSLDRGSGGSHTYLLGFSIRVGRAKTNHAENDANPRTKKLRRLMAGLVPLRDRPKVLEEPKTAYPILVLSAIAFDTK